jgi:hypothetical protein
MPADEWEAHCDEPDDDPDAWADVCDDPAREDFAP